jgi:hypothetical protein
LSKVSELSNVRLGIIPAKTPAEVFCSHGFHIYDGTSVQVGTKTGTALTSKAHDVQTYVELFGELKQLAIYDDDARALLGRVAEEYRYLKGER